MSSFRGLKTVLSVVLLAAALLWTLPPLLLWLMNLLEQNHGLPPMTLALLQARLPWWMYCGSDVLLWGMVYLAFKEAGERN